MHCPFLNLLGWGGSSYNFPNAFCKRGRSLPAPSAPDIRKWWKRQCWNSRFHHSYANVKIWVKVIQSKQLACIIDRDATEEKLMAVSWKGILHWMVGSWLYTVEAGKNCFRTKLSSLSHFETPPDQIAILQLNTINPERNIWTIVNDLRKYPYRWDPVQTNWFNFRWDEQTVFVHFQLLLSRFTSECAVGEPPRTTLGGETKSWSKDWVWPSLPTNVNLDIQHAEYLETTWGLLGDNLGTNWTLLGDYLGTTWRVLGDYLDTTCRLLGEYLGTT